MMTTKLTDFIPLNKPAFSMRPAPTTLVGYVYHRLDKGGSDSPKCPVQQDGKSKHSHPSTIQPWFGLYFVFPYTHIAILAPPSGDASHEAKVAKV